MKRCFGNWAMRQETEAAFNVKPEKVNPAVDFQIHLTASLKGGWFALTENSGDFLGAIGIFLFDHPSGRIARLQEVDIRPGSQGRGYGHLLLYRAAVKARQWGCRWMTLCTDSHDWPKLYYAKNGFVKTGEWFVSISQPARS